MEALAPTPLVENGGQLVVRVDEGGVLALPLCHAGFVALRKPGQGMDMQDCRCWPFINPLLEG